MSVVVVDSSLVVAALVGGGLDGEWALEVLSSGAVAAPHLLPVEAANVLRRLQASGSISADVASLAHADLVVLPITLHGYEPCADRVWELRENLTAYDAWYVALAELLDAPLSTLDVRLARSPGPRCPVRTPPTG